MSLVEFDGEHWDCNRGFVVFVELVEVASCSAVCFLMRRLARLE